MLEKLVSFCKRMLLNEALFCGMKLFSECVCEIDFYYNTLLIGLYASPPYRPASSREDFTISGT